MFSAKSIRRMKDIEFTSELLIGVLNGPQAGRSRTIDDFYLIYDDYEGEFPEEKKAIRLYKKTLKIITDLLPDILESRWSNRADFYSLFVAVADILKEKEIAKTKTGALRRRILEFGVAVDERLKDEKTRVDRDTIEYVRAIEKGVNEKPRRVIRHAVLTRLIDPYFKNK